MHDDGRRADCGGDAFRTSTGASTGHRDSRRARGPIKAGFFTDLIVIPGNPLDEVDALKNVQFVMKDGQVFM